MSGDGPDVRTEPSVLRKLLPLLLVGLAGLVALAVRAAFLLGIEAYPKFELIRNRLDDQVFFHAWALAMVQERPLDLLATAHEFAYWVQARPGVFPQDRSTPGRWPACIGPSASSSTSSVGRRRCSARPPRS